jgi:hypothetical protein
VPGIGLPRDAVRRRKVLGEEVIVETVLEQMFGRCVEYRLDEAIVKERKDEVVAALIECAVMVVKVAALVVEEQKGVSLLLHREV